MQAIYFRIIVFFALSCALSWIGNLGNFLWPSETWPSMNPFGPIIAAPIVIGCTEGRPGFRAWWRRITHFRASARVYSVAFCVPLSFIAVSFALTVALGADLLPLPSYDMIEVLITIAVVVVIFGPMTEEVSFRGYGLDALQSAISPLAASFWIGAGVALWHLPLFLSGELPLTVLMPLAGVSVVYGWLYRVGGSVWPLVVLHGQLNCVANLVTGPMMPNAFDQAVYLAILGVFYLAWAGLIVWRTGPSLEGRRSRGLQAEESNQHRKRFRRSRHEDLSSVLVEVPPHLL